jgi:hypothetical protein
MSAKAPTGIPPKSPVALTTVLCCKVFCAEIQTSTLVADPRSILSKYGVTAEVDFSGYLSSLSGLDK